MFDLTCRGSSTTQPTQLFAKPQREPLKGGKVRSGLLARLMAATALFAAALQPTIVTAQDVQNQPVTTASATKRPNILFIIADDLNARLAPYGGEAITPNLDKLASQGLTFDRAYAQYPWCAPSRSSFLTGTRPDTVGVSNLTTPVRANLPDIRTLPQYFREHGYFAGRVGKIFHQGVPGGIGRAGLDDAQSWDVALNPSGCDVSDEDRLVNLTPGLPLGTAFTYLQHDCQDFQQTDGMVATQTIDLLRKHAGGDQPFFIAAGFYRPHVPLVAPKRYFDLYPTEGIRLPNAGSANVLPAARTWKNTDNFGMTEAEQKAFIRAYLASISFLDAQVGRLLKAVEELGLADDTIVVFTSDHGYLLGEHGEWQKQSLFEESAHVPLIFRVPGTKNAGKHSRRTVELLDIYPTLTDLAGLPHYRRNEGVSLKRLLDNPEDQSWTKPALSQVTGGRSVRTERYRYTEWAGGTRGRELYDHAADPKELNNLAADPRYAGAVELLRAMLPPAPVERLADKGSYDPDHDCIVPASRYTTSRGATGGGAPPAGMKICPGD